MNEKGFIASSLLYGLLVIFLVVMLSTIAVLANKKLSSDKLKETAIDDVSADYSSANLIHVWYDSYYVPYLNNNQIVWKDVVSGHTAALSGFASNVEYSKGITFDQNKNIIASSVALKDIVSKDTDFSFSAYIRIDNPPCETDACPLFRLGDITSNFVRVDASSNDYNLELCYPKIINSGVNSNEPSVSCIEVSSTDFYNNENTPVTLTVIFQSGAIRAFIDNKQVNNPDDINVSGGTLDTSSNYPLTIGGGFVGTIYNFIIYKGILSDAGVEKNTIQNKTRYKVE